MFTEQSLAIYIISICTKNKIHISNRKLQAILYFVQATFLAKRKEAAFKENIEATQFGPIIRSVYDQYRKFGAGLIMIKMDSKCNLETCEAKSEIDVRSYEQIVEKVIRIISNYSTDELFEIIQKQEPWEKTLIPGTNIIDPLSRIIKKEDIKDFFKTK